MSQPNCTIVRTIMSKKQKTPIMIYVSNNDKNPSSLIYNEENVILGFGVHNHKTLKTTYAVYRMTNGKPHLSRFYYCGGANGIRVSNPDHAAPVNWLQGITERALTNKLKEGSYYLSSKSAHALDSEKLKLPLNLKSCIELADFLKPAQTSIPFDVWVVDEIGAPNPVEEFEMDSDKLRRLVTNRFLSNMWGINPSLAQSWKNAVIRGQRLKEYLFGQEASTQLEIIQDGLREQVIEHARSKWCDESGKLKFPWFSGHGAKLNRIIDFYPDLVNQGMITLQRCASVHEINTPLIAGVVGSPVSIGQVDLPNNWRFPVTWKNSPFEKADENYAAVEQVTGDELVTEAA